MNTQVSLLPGRRTKGNLVAVCTRFWRFSTGDFGRKSPTSTEKSGRLKPGKLLNQIEHIRNKARQFQCHCFNIQGAAFLKTQGLFIDSPVVRGIHSSMFGWSHVKAFTDQCFP